MYRLSRVLMMMAAFVAGYCIVVVAILYRPQGMWLLAVAVFALAVGRRRRRLTTLGSGKLADRSDLYRSGMIGADHGLIVGQLAQSRPSLHEWSRMLFDRRIDPRAFCRSFWLNPSRTGCDVVRLTRSVHCSIYAPSGSGKGVGILTPHLLDCPEPVVVFDPKGELALRVGRHREKRFKHRLVLLDCFKQITQYPDCYNPLDFIAPGSPHLIEDCKSIGDSMVVRSGDEREPHWSDMASAVLSALCVFVTLHGKRNETRSLQTVRDFASNPKAFATAIEALSQCSEFGGIAARIGGQLLCLEDREKSSVMSSVGRHSGFLDAPAVAECTSRSTFDPSELRRGGKMSVFIIIPPDRIRTTAPLVRLYLSSLMRAVVREGVQE